MKKLIAILLALLCVVSLVACNPTNPGGDTEQKGDLSLFTNALKTVSPKTSMVRTTMTSDLGTLNGKFEITYAGDDRATVKYEVEQFNEITDTTSEDFEPKSTKTGTITYEDGKYTTDDGVTREFTLANELKLNLDPEKMVYTIEDGNTTLKATVQSKDTKDVLGTAINAEVTLTVKRNDTTITSVTITYETKAGTATIVCDYNS
ncbi:MAG TPA: hypothetical protein DDY70_05750 [Clostridiales bacterium]|nr:hypothetical protein [Clostridiales bacterium]